MEKESKVLLSALMESIPDSIYFKDREHKFIAVSKSKAEHHNADPEDFIGKTDSDFYPKEEAEKMYEDDEHVLKTGEAIVNREEKVTKEDGTPRWYSVTKVPFRDGEGNIIGTLGISRDITKQVKAKEEISGLESKIRSLLNGSK